MFDVIALVILIGAGLVVISIFTSLISFRVGAPLLLVFLGIGLLAGVDGPGGIVFENAQLAYFIGSVALAVILFDSGIGTRFQTVKAAAGPSLVLATVGVAMTAGLVAVPAHYLLGVDWLYALLLGAVVSSTDAAAVFFLLRVGGLKLRERMRATLEVESGSNDPMAIFLTVALIELIMAGGASAQSLTISFLTTFSLQMGLGLGLGLASGFLIVLGLNRIKLEPGLFPVIILGLALVVFSLTSILGGSGFLAVYVAGIVMGNMRLKGAVGFRRFQDGLTWLAQITMFLVLGLLATPSQFPQIALPAIGVALALIFVIRPLAVWLCLLPFGFPRQETAFVGWVGLRGAVSILLAIFPIVAGLENGQLIFNTAFIIVLTSLLVQGWTVSPMARWLGLTVPPRIGPVEKVELELPGDARHELVVYRVAPESPVARGERIPRWARPSLTVRDGRSLRLHEAGRPQPGDYLYIFALPSFIPLLDRLFANPAEISREDTVYFGEFGLEPDRPLSDAAKAYGFAVGEDEAGQPIGDVLRARLGGAAVRGDRVLMDPVELIVRDTDEEGRISAVGVRLEPRSDPGARLPVFFSAQDMIAGLRARLKEKRGGSGA
jgi:cell volume regulation protein A